MIRKMIYTIVDKVAQTSTPLFLASGDEHAQREFKRFLTPAPTPDGTPPVSISPLDFDLRCLGQFCESDTGHFSIGAADHDYPYHVANGGEVVDEKVDGNNA